MFANMGAPPNGDISQQFAGVAPMAGMGAPLGMPILADAILAPHATPPWGGVEFF